MLISLIGAISLLPNIMSNVSAEFIAVLTVIIVLIYIFFELYRIRKVKEKVLDILRFVTSKKKFYIWLCVGILIVLWQLYLIHYLAGISYWDPGIIEMTAARKRVWVVGYFSTNPNNILILLIEHAIWVIFNRPSVYLFSKILSVVNLFAVDSSLIIIIYLLKKLLKRKKTIFFSSICFTCLIVLPAWILIPYTDTFGLFMTCISVLFIYKAYISDKKNIWIVFNVVTFCVSYFFKPSLVITYVAALLILITTGLSNIRYKKDFKVSQLLLTVIVLIVSFGCIKFTINNQKFIKVDNSKSETLTHFVAMGMIRSGGYHLPDVQMDARISNPQKRNQANIKLIKKRLTDFGSPFNYEKFLIRKQINNTADGTFAWGVDGIFLKPYSSNNKKLNDTFARKMFSKNGVAALNDYEYMFLVQFVWIIVLFMCLMCVTNSSWIVQLLKYGIVGFFIFLLIFEGGRSRYVIQFLPLIILLSGIGFEKFIDILNTKSSNTGVN